MIRLLDPSASVTSEIGIEPELVDDPKIAVLLAKGERCVGASLQERDVVTLGDWSCRRVVEELPGVGCLGNPYFCDGDRGYERRDDARCGGTGQRILDTDTMKALPEFGDELSRGLGQQVATGPDRSVNMLLGPKIQQGGGIQDVARPERTGTRGVDNALTFKA